MLAELERSQGRLGRDELSMPPVPANVGHQRSTCLTPAPDSCTLHEAGYHRLMSTILQVRDVPEDVLARLRKRAAARGTSLSAYVRELLADDARQETMDEVIRRIATRTPVEVSDEEILAAIHEGRR